MTRDEVVLLLLDNDIDFEITYEHSDGMHLIIRHDEEENKDDK